MNIDGAARAQLAAVGPGTGVLDERNLGPDQDVLALELSGDPMIVVGRSRRPAGPRRQLHAAFRRSSGQRSLWSPELDSALGASVVTPHAAEGAKVVAESAEPEVPTRPGAGELPESAWSRAVPVPHSNSSLPG